MQRYWQAKLSTRRKDSGEEGQEGGDTNNTEADGEQHAQEQQPPQTEDAAPPAMDKEGAPEATSQPPQQETEQGMEPRDSNTAPAGKRLSGDGSPFASRRKLKTKKETRERSARSASFRLKQSRPRRPQFKLAVQQLTAMYRLQKQRSITTEAEGDGVTMTTSETSQRQGVAQVSLPRRGSMPPRVSSDGMSSSSSNKQLDEIAEVQGSDDDASSDALRSTPTLESSSSGLGDISLDDLLETLANVVNETEDDAASESAETFQGIMTSIQEKQFNLDRTTLEWTNPPKNILVIKKLHDDDVTDWFITVTSHLIEKYPNSKIFFQPQMLGDEAERDYLKENKEVRDHLKRLHTWKASDSSKHDGLNFDLIITLGGDGTLLHVSHSFQKRVPPVISFALGSLGFLTQFNIKNYEDVIETVLMGGQPVTLRMRLHCQIVQEDTRRCSDVGSGKATRERARLAISSSSSSVVDGDSADLSAQDKKDVEDGYITVEQAQRLLKTGPAEEKASTDGGNGEEDCVDEPAQNPSEEQVGHIHHSKSFFSQSSAFDNEEADADVTYEVLNEIVVDRGMSPYLTKLLVYVGDVMVTTVQGDGLIIATPTGSTAYSLAAGGSMCHPSVPCVLITPICPHSLSFRPIIVPSSVPIRVMVPSSARYPATVSFDGRHREVLKRGMSIILSPSRYPIPTINKDSVSQDWFRSLSACLGWNVREQQKPFDAKKKDKTKKERK